MILPEADEFKEKEPPRKAPDPNGAKPSDDAITLSTRAANSVLTSTISDDPKSAGDEPKADTGKTSKISDTKSEDSKTDNSNKSKADSDSTQTVDSQKTKEQTTDGQAAQFPKSRDLTPEEAQAAFKKFFGPKSTDGTSANDTPANDTTAVDFPNNPLPKDAAAAPIEIMIDESGNLVLSSEDTEALDRLESLMQSNKPPKRPYDLFYVRYTRATWIVLNLQDYFKNDDSKKDDNRDQFMSWFFGMPSDKKKSSTPERQLGKKVPLRFLADNDTNTIIVQGANDVERQTIQELINLWDVAEPINDSNVRYTRIIKIEYSQAETIAEVIKDAYRDYLSASDKAFQQQNNNNNRSGGSENKRNASSEMVSGSSGENYSLKGKLSVGVDTVTNSIVVFAQGKTLLDVVCKMIEELDESAKPQGSIKILDMSATTNADSVEKALRAIISKNKQSKNAPNNQPNQNQPRNNNAPGDE